MATDLFVHPRPHSGLFDGLFARMGQKDFNILTRTMAQPVPGQKINKGLHPFDIKVRMIGKPPVVLYTDLKSIPRFLNCCRFLWTFLFIKTNQCKELIHNLQLCNRQNYDITFRKHYHNTRDLWNIF